MIEPFDNEATMDAEAVVRRFYEAMNSGDGNLVDEVRDKVLAPNWVNNPLAPEQSPGCESFRPTVVWMGSMFSNFTITHEDIIVFRDRVAMRSISRGTHSGELLGVPTTGWRITYRTFDFHEPTLHHINPKTKRLQEMIDWYGTMVGMKSTYQFPGGTWLTNDAANHHLALLTSPQLNEDPDKLTHTGIHHSAYEYATIDNLLDTYTRLKGLGIETHTCLDHDMTTSFYYVDPDGNSVEPQVDNFEIGKESSEWMRPSPQFAADPIGIPIYPTQIVETRKAGASFADIHRRAYASEFQPASLLGLRVPPRDPRAPL